MADTKYILRYLPLFYEELEEKVVYIAETLKNPQAANNLLDLVESAILERLPNAESFEPYHSLKERRDLDFIGESLEFQAMPFGICKDFLIPFWNS